MRPLSLFLCFLCLVIATASAQRWERDSRDSEERQQMFLLYEPLFIPGADSAGCRIDIPYRISLDFFISVRSRTAPPDRPYAKKGELLIELFDSTGTSAARVIEPIEAVTASVELEHGHGDWHEGIASLPAAPGIYTVLIELTDLQSRRNYAERYRTIRVPLWRAGEVALSTPFFVRGKTGKPFPDTLRLENSGDDYMFGTKASFLFLMNGADTGSAVISYVLSVDDRRAGSPKEMRRDSSARVFASSPSTLKPGWDSAGVFYTLAPGSLSSVVAVPLPLEELPLRNYVVSLTLRQGTQSQTVTWHFRALWPDMPMSLRDVDMAIEALRILIPETEVDRLKKGDFETKRDNLEAFWKTRDRTPGTAYNELMAEYYRRVDYAMRTYGTLRQPDGSRTDRGKIYVLYGSPSSTERTLNPAGPHREVWVYEKLGRTFVFVDQARTGNYVLAPSGGS